LVRGSVHDAEEVETGINHKVTWPKHQRVHAWHGGNLFDVRKTLDRLNLGDNADVVVCRRDVVRVSGVKRCIRDARSEGPWAERTVSKWGYAACQKFAYCSDGGLRTVVHLLDHAPDLIGSVDVGDDNTRCTGIERRRQRDLVVLGDPDNHHGAALRVVLSGVDSADIHVSPT
jgi:hypothetical protein